MENLETLATSDAHDRRRTKQKNTTQKTKKMSNSDATKNKVITEKWRFTCGHSEYTILYYYCRKEDSKINSY
jgi:hypothetical protein